MLYGSSAWQHLEYGSVPLLVNRQRGWYPVQLFNTVFDTVKQLYETKGLIEEQTGTAILIIQGSFDKIVSMTATTQFFRELVEEAPNNDYHHYISDGSPHVVMEGPHRDDVMSFMTKWMKDRS
jgi:esterase/lipase